MTHHRPREHARRLQGVRRAGHRPGPGRRGLWPGVPARRSSPVAGARTVVVGHDMRPSSPGLAGGVRRGRGGRRRRRGDDRAGLDRPALLRLRPPRPPRRDVHREPQPGAVQRDQAVPRGRPADRRGHRAARDPRRSSPGRRADAVAPPGQISEHDVLDAYAAHLLSLAPVDRPPAQGRRRRRQRDGGSHRPGRLRPARRPGRAGADVLRARRHLPAPRGQPDRAGEPRRPPGAGARRGRRPRPGLRRRRRPLLRGRRARRGRVPVDAHRADRGPRAGQGSPAPR